MKVYGSNAIWLYAMMNEAFMLGSSVVSPHSCLLLKTWSASIYFIGVRPHHRMVPGKDVRYEGISFWLSRDTYVSWPSLWWKFLGRPCSERMVGGFFLPSRLIERVNKRTL